MDVDRVFYQTEAKDEDKAKRLAYMKQVGSAGSAFEHAVPEKLFIDTSTCNAPGTPTPDPTKPACAQGVSAVKALALAAAQGQKIYTLNKQNQAYHASIVQSLGTDADAKAEIANALAAGKEVTVHQADINVSGWTGSGYVILDPDTGAGAYKISGGANGGALFGSAILGLIGMFFLVNGIGPAILAALLISLAIHVAVIALGELIAEGAIDPTNVLAGSAAALGLMRAIAVLLAGVTIGGGFAVPDGLIMGVILIASAIWGFTKIGR